MSCSLRACACVFDAKKADLPCARTTYAPPRICPPQPRFRLAENRNIAPFSARAFLSCPSLDGGVRPSGWGSPQGGPRRICVSKGSWDTNPLAIEEAQPRMSISKACEDNGPARRRVETRPSTLRNGIRISGRTLPGGNREPGRRLPGKLGGLFEIVLERKKGKWRKSK